MKRMISFYVGFLLVFAGFTYAPYAHGETIEREPAFTFVFPWEDTDRVLAMEADRAGGFYLLTVEAIYHWSPGDETLTQLCLNEHQLQLITCDEQRMCAMSQDGTIYLWRNEAWESLGKPPWKKDETNAKDKGPIYPQGSMELGPDRLFFFYGDHGEGNYFCTYLFETGAYSYEEAQVFSRSWCVYDAANQTLVGIASDEKDNEFLAAYDYLTKEIALKHPLKYAGYIITYDIGKGWTLAGSSGGIVTGPNDNEMKLVPGISGHLNATPLDETHIGGFRSSMQDPGQMVYVYQYDLNELVPYSYE